jgi:hypothetical protein
MSGDNMRLFEIQSFPDRTPMERIKAMNLTTAKDEAGRLYPDKIVYVTEIYGL